MSRTAAPVGEVTSAMEDGQAGIGFFVCLGNRPSACSFAFQLLKGDVQRTCAVRNDLRDIKAAPHLCAGTS